MKPLIIVVLLVVVGGGTYFIYQSTGQKPVEQPAVSQGNFTQKGNVSVQEDGSLWLVWDEPGKMAMNVKLKFNEQSTCILGGEKKDCSLLSKDQGSYYVNVNGNREGEEVTVIKLEEQKPPQ